jgi:type II secretory pathway component GspD/PulD (secretin)
MRKIGMRVGLLILGLSVLPASFAPQAKAQEDEKATTVYVMPVKNVRAEVMAYWITPRKTISPKSQKLDEKSFAEVSSLGDIPGLESITANSTKNELWVKGTPDSVGKLKEIVAFLDRPIRNVEIKAQFVEVDAAEMAGLGIVEDTDSKVKTTSFGKTSTIVFDQIFRDKLRTLIANKRAAVIQSAQMTTMNNSTSNVSWNSYATLPPTELRITPTIQNDDTITLYLMPSIKESTPISNDMPKWFVSTVANVKKGDSILVQMKQSTLEGRMILLLVSAQVVQDKIELLD